MSYLVAIVVFVLLCAAWGAFQLWLGRQADGTPVDSDTRVCHGCGGADEQQDKTTTHSGAR